MDTVKPTKGGSMVTTKEVDRQLQAVGASRGFWTRAEIRELQHVLIPNENIQFCTSGRYEGGRAILCVTDQRIILIDKKPFYLTMEDLRYDMIAEVDFSARLLSSSVRIITTSKELRFRSRNGHEMRRATSYMQHRVMEFRQSHMMSQPTSSSEPYAELAYAAPPSVAPPSASMQQSDPTNASDETGEPKMDTALTFPLNPVSSLQHNVVNPYIRVPLMMRRRVSRFSNMI